MHGIDLVYHIAAVYRQQGIERQLFKDINGAPQVSIREGVARTAAWYVAQNLL